MTGAGETNAPVEQVLTEYDIIALRLSGAMPPLPLNDSANVIVEEALARFAPSATTDKIVTSFSNADIGQWLSNDPNPPVSVKLVSAHKLLSGEFEPGEKRWHYAAAAGNVLLKAGELLFHAPSLIAPQPLKTVLHSVAALAAVGEYGIRTAEAEGQSAHFRAVNRWVRREHAVVYNNNSEKRTGPEERSLAAWMLADCLEDLCAQGQIRPGCELLAENIATRLCELYDQKIRIALPISANDIRPAGIELLELCQRLKAGWDIPESIAIFNQTTAQMQQKRVADAAKALKVRNPTSMPSSRSIASMLPEARRYNRDIERPADELHDLSIKAAEEFQIARRAQQPGTEHLEDLARYWMAANERRTLAPKGSEAQRFGRICDFVSRSYAQELITLLFEQSHLIGSGEASLAVQKLAYYYLYEEKQSPFTGTNRSEVEDALYEAARRWYNQGDDYHTARGLSMTGKKTKYMQFVETRFTRMPLARSLPVRRQSGRVQIGTYLYQAAALANVDQRLNRRRLEMAKRLIPSGRSQRRLVIHDLPQACFDCLQGA